MSDNFCKISIGTAQFGMDYGISNNNGKVSKAEAHNILRYASEVGIQSIDTAKNYGDSEKIIGDYIKSNTKFNWKISTKIANADQTLVDCLESSSKNLSSTPNILLAHNHILYKSNNFQSQIINLRKSFPKVKIGVSVYTEEDINSVLKSRHLPEVIQLPINILDTTLLLNGIISELKEKNIEVHARSIFLQGLFFLKRESIKKKFSDAYPVIQELQHLTKEYNITISELSLIWVNSISEIKKIIIGIDHVDQLKNNIKTLGKKIESDLLEKVLEIKYNNKDILNPQNW